MKQLLYSLSITLLISCSPETICDDLICTLEFRSVNIKFLDAEGDPLVVKDFKAINLRTQKSMVTENLIDTIYAKGIYTVASDANLHDLSEKGDKIRVSAKHPVNGITKESEFVITGGKCSCHVGKISGPEQIKFEDQ